MNHGTINGYISDLTDGTAHFLRVLIEREGGMVWAYDSGGKVVASETIKNVAKLGTMKDQQGSPRFHVTVYVRRECMIFLNTVPTKVPF